jgi:hypothetical protein
VIVCSLPPPPHASEASPSMGLVSFSCHPFSIRWATLSWVGTKRRSCLFSSLPLPDDLHTEMRFPPWESASARAWSFSWNGALCLRSHSFWTCRMVKCLPHFSLICLFQPEILYTDLSSARCGLAGIIFPHFAAKIATPLTSDSMPSFVQVLRNRPKLLHRGL